MSGMEWIEKAARAFPPGRYNITGKRFADLVNAVLEPENLDDALDAISAAYNEGFKRGRNYERRQHKVVTPPTAP